MASRRWWHWPRLLLSVDCGFLPQTSASSHVTLEEKLPELGGNNYNAKGPG